MWTQVESFRSAIFLVWLTFQGPSPSSSEIEVEGVITASSDSTLELFQGLVRVDFREATFESEGNRTAGAASLKPGVSVEILAVATSSGVLRASEVEIGDEDDANGEIRGEIVAVNRNARTFRIGPMEITWTPETTFAGVSGLEVGVIVETAVRVADGKLVAVTVGREER